MSLLEGLKVQARVIEALMLREIHTINGDSKLGYLWVLIQTGFGIAVFWVLRSILGASSPHGMPTPFFLASGFCIFAVFSDVIMKSLTAVQANRPLLTFPQVTPFDVMVARMLVISATQYLTIFIIIGLGILFDYSLSVYSFGLLLFVVFISPLFALGLGMIFASLAVYLPVLNKLVPMGLRILFFISGVFFSASTFGGKVASWLLFNPVLQLIELFRSGLDASYRIQGLSVTYVSGVTLCTLVLGGFLELHSRVRRLSCD